LIQRNIQEGYCGRGDESSVSSRCLMWGEKDQLMSLVESPPEVIIGLFASLTLLMDLLGADIILWPGFVRPLVLTLRWLLSFHPK
jgi:hypothetical protein